MVTPPPQGPRALLRRLREIMAEAGSAQSRLDHVVRAVAANMVAEVCSLYLVRNGALELFSTEGLNPAAVHKTTLRLGEGLIGLIAQHARPLSIPDAQSHPNFAYRPETGEEIFSSLMGVPVLRGGRVVGVLAVQNRTRRQYAEDEIEAMQTIAMVLAEMAAALVSSVPGSAPAAAPGMPTRLAGLTLNEGLAIGHAVLHEPRVVVERHLADDPGKERERLDRAIVELRAQVDTLLEDTEAGPGGEPREILETYRMFAHDRGWIARLQEGVASGLTAEAAVERVQVESRARLGQVTDPYLRERLHDLEDLTNRLLRALAGRAGSAAFETLPPDAVVVARAMGPAELLDYDRAKLKALVLEDGSPTSHVAIVARALQIPVIGRIEGLLDKIDTGDVILVDGDNAQVFVRPAEDVQRAFRDNLAAREARFAQYAALRDVASATKDGERVSLIINAGLLIDLQHMAESGADGIGLYRTELHFMVRATLPDVEAQTRFYARALEQAGDKPVVFRTLDVGGDKVLPYLSRHEDEENPAMGWRAIRLSLDRPVLLRMQLRALLRAAAGRRLHVMFPMIAEVAEFVAARAVLDKEAGRMERLKQPMPAEIKAGTMLEVPSLAFQLPSLLPLVDFVSIGSNDLMQFLFASDRGSPRLANRYDLLSPAALKVLRSVVRACDEAHVPVSLCGEAAGRPLEAMALIGLGLRSLSMSSASIGPVKAMLRRLDARLLACRMDGWLDRPDHSLRPELLAFAQANGVLV